MTQFTITEQHVNDQQHDNAGMAKDGSHPQMTETVTYTVFQLQVLEKSLKDDQPGK